MKSILATAVAFLAIVSISAMLPSCAQVQKLESKLGITQQSIAALNVKLSQDAIAGLMELATKKPGLAAEDTAFAVINDIVNQVAAKDSGASAVTVAISTTGQKALADYQAKASKAQWLTDGMSSALALLTATAPAAPAPSATGAPGA